MMCVVLMYRSRRAEARIHQMLWKVNYSDIVFINTVCISSSPEKNTRMYTCVLDIDMYRLVQRADLTC